MTSNRSFKDYVADRFYNELFAAIKDYAEENGEDLDLRLYQIRNISSMELSDIDVKFVFVNDLPEMDIEFDVAVEAEFGVCETDYHYDDSEFAKQWFMLKCSGNLEDSLNVFTISSITIYSGKNKLLNPLSDFLVPIMRKLDLEVAATDFLKRNYPKVLLEPMAIESQKLAENMGLEVHIQKFLDMIAPSVIKFETDYFISSNTYRCVWALREYPTATNEQVILSHLGDFLYSDRITQNRKR